MLQLIRETRVRVAEAVVSLMPVCAGRTEVCLRLFPAASLFPHLEEAARGRRLDTARDAAESLLAVSSQAPPAQGAVCTGSAASTGVNYMCFFSFLSDNTYFMALASVWRKQLMQF